ncbi:MAG TPA: threonine synthase [Mycobacteriales bacterium]|nr:threonine synthase [Mycobacteriales bacterium]
MRKDGLALTVTGELPATRFGPATGLGCRECGSRYPLGPVHACIECFGPLEVAAELPSLSRADIEGSPETMWRYAALLPVPAAPDDHLAPGFTPLVRADRLARALGMRRLWVKDDRANPTHSFKDRVVAVAFAAGRALGFDTFACASTGNLANAVASAAARAGVRAVVFIPHDLEAGKIVATAVYGVTLVAVEGSYDDVNRLCSEVAGEEPWGFVNVNLRPFYAEGSKTLGFEVAEQLGWRLPAQTVVPVASGSLLTKVDKAFRELTTLGLVDPAPYRVFGAQPSGCSPVATAYKAGQDVVRPVRPNTIAKSLAIGNPADGPYAIDVVRRTGGAFEDVPDAEVVEGMRLLAETEGIFAETAGGVTVAVLRRLLAAGHLDADAETVLLNTGDGLKTLDAVAETVGPTVTIPASLDAFRAAVPA